jgi:hypothetical protein
MKKIFTLIAMALMAVGVNAQTATDAYLDVAQYATLDNIDLKNCTKLYSYDAEQKILVLSAYAAYQSSLQSQPDKNGLGFVTYYTSSGSSKVSWEATGVFNGSAYYGLLDNDGNASDRAAALKASQAYSFKVTNITSVSVLGKSGKKTERQVIMTVMDGDTEVASKTDDTNTITALTVDGLDASKIYEIIVKGNTSDNGHFYEIAFTQAGGGVQPADPTPATTWNFTSELSSADAANLAADEATWSFVDDKYWSNQVTLTERNVYTAIKANGEELDITKGLAFTRDNNSGLDKDRIRIAPGKYFAINGSAITIKIANLAKNDVIRLRLKGAGVSDRQIVIVNGDKASIPNQTEGEGDEKTAVMFETEFNVESDGDLVLAPSNGFQFFAITINNALPEYTGIENITTTATTTTGAIYNLAGQKVSESYKGVVVQNGKKMIQK